MEDNHIHSLQEWIRKEIPMLNYQDIHLDMCSPLGVQISAPLQNNKNLHQSAYAGSLSSLLTIAAWLQFKIQMEDIYPEAYLVLQECQVKYIKPVRGDIKAQSIPTIKEAWSVFLNELKKEGKARINIESQVFYQGQLCAYFKGLFYGNIKKAPT